MQRVSFVSRVKVERIDEYKNSPLLRLARNVAAEPVGERPWRRFYMFDLLTRFW